MDNDYYAGALGNLGGIDKVLFEYALDQWTERPQLGCGYNKRILKLYDALIWTRIENDRDELKSIKRAINNRKIIQKKMSCKNISSALIPEVNDDLIKRLEKANDNIKSWKYTGKIYRVINCKAEEVEYHKLIASWVKNPRAFASFNHLYDSHDYTFLIGSTKRDWGFDLNKYRKATNNRHPNTEYELEIILPTDKKYIDSVFYGSLDKFYKYIGMNIKRKNIV